MCAKSSTQRMTAGTEGEFLHELEEKMEVCDSLLNTCIYEKQSVYLLTVHDERLLISVLTSELIAIDCCSLVCR